MGRRAKRARNSPPHLISLLVSRSAATSQYRDGMSLWAVNLSEAFTPSSEPLGFMQLLALVDVDARQRISKFLSPRDAQRK